MEGKVIETKIEIEKLNKTFLIRPLWQQMNLQAEMYGINI